MYMFICVCIICLDAYIPAERLRIKWRLAAPHPKPAYQPPLHQCAIAHGAPRAARYEGSLGPLVGGCSAPERDGVFNAYSAPDLYHKTRVNPITKLGLTRSFRPDGAYK